jgi:hypothetical protein
MTLTCSVNDLFWLGVFNATHQVLGLKTLAIFQRKAFKRPLPLTTHQLQGDSLFWCSVTITSTRSARVGYASLFPAGGAQKTHLSFTTHQLHGDSLFWCSVTITSTRSARVGYASLFPEEGVQTTPLPLTIHQLYGYASFIPEEDV